LICPLGDFIRRRQVVLTLVLLTTFLTIGLAITENSTAFSCLAFIVGLLNVAPQILIPLVAETAPAEMRAFAFSIVLSGLMFGILLARVVAGLIAEWAPWRIVYYASVGLQVIVLAGLYIGMPDHPRKATGKVKYWRIHWSMVVMAVTKPVAVQVILINLGASACFSYFWVTLTFLLGGEPYKYSTCVRNHKIQEFTSHYCHYKTCHWTIWLDWYGGRCCWTTEREDCRSSSTMALPPDMHDISSRFPRRISCRWRDQHIGSRDFVLWSRVFPADTNRGIGYIYLHVSRTVYSDVETKLKRYLPAYPKLRYQD